MDRFLDDAARILASATSRRQALRLLGGALMASLVGALTTIPVSAACTSTSCGTGNQCCPGGSKGSFCAPNTEVCCGSKTCANGIACCNGSCCKAGQGCLGGRCNSSIA